MHITEETRTYLLEAAKRSEVPSFTEGDPSFVLYIAGSEADIESAAFVASQLSFGRRQAFIPKIRLILDAASDLGMFEWLLSGHFHSFFEGEKDGEKKFYRFYSYNDLKALFIRLSLILQKNGTLGSYFRAMYEKSLLTGKEEALCRLVSSSFVGLRMVAHGKTSPLKRINMFLRWMVRQNSPVDRGFWNWYPENKLIIPLDTHVLSESIRLGLLEEGSRATFRTALLLTNILKEIWPADPSKGDFALFSSGIFLGKLGGKHEEKFDI